MFLNKEVIIIGTTERELYDTDITVDDNENIIEEQDDHDIEEEEEELL